MTLNGKQITVVGGGIGGLAAAVAMAQRGGRVTVLEQAEAITEVGAGLQIGPNGYTVLRALGLGDALAAKSVRATGVRLLDGVSGQQVFALDFQRFRPDQHYYMVHRADLIDVLAEAARAAGVEIRLSQRLESVAFDQNQAQLQMADGQVLMPELFICAGGLHSKLRPVINGKREPFFTKQVAWRMVIPALGGEAPMAQVFMGHGKHLVTYPLRGGELINVVAVQERDIWAAEGWNYKTDPAELSYVFGDFCDEVQALFERVEDVYLWGLFRHPVAARWHQGNAALLGDAAHPTLPFMAQGAVMALEDAWVLADALDQDTPVEQALASYQNRRRQRAAAVVEAANQNARNYHFGPGPKRSLAHLALRMGSRLAPGLALKKYDWIYGYDVTKES
ncbi:MAG: monooxygenase [Rhodobacterales bacterium]|nr:MAG: monooxygenase [Rhodobacterales bacterium]